LILNRIEPFLDVGEVPIRPTKLFGQMATIMNQSIHELRHKDLFWLMHKGLAKELEYSLDARRTLYGSVHPGMEGKARGLFGIVVQTSLIVQPTCIELRSCSLNNPFSVIAINVKFEV